MTKMDAIVLAGEKEGAIPVKGGNKAFLPFRDKPLVAWVVECLDRSEQVSSITVVGPRGRLEEKLAGYESKKPLRVLEQGKTIFENMWRGALTGFSGYKEGVEIEELRRSPEADRAVAALTCDMPLIEPAEVDAFISTVPLDRADLVFGMTRSEILKPYEPTDQDPGIIFTYICIRDRIYRHANIFCFRPLRFAHVMEKYVPLVYSLRYQRHLKNVLAAARESLRFARNPGSLLAFFLTESASYCHNHGHYRLREVFRRPIRLEWAEKAASRTIETRFAVHETAGPGLTLDIDDEESYRAFLTMFDRWKQIQAVQIRDALEERGDPAKAWDGK